MKALKVHFEAEQGWIHNLGDALVPRLLGALGFRCLTRRAADHSVLNPGRCLLVIGSLLTSSDLRRIEEPVDVWGCGWKGREAIEGFEGSVTYHAVRGPLTAAGLCPEGNVALDALEASSHSFHGTKQSVRSANLGGTRPAVPARQVFLQWCFSSLKRFRWRFHQISSFR